MKKWTWWGVLILALAVAIGCEEGDDSNGSIVGDYTDEWGSAYSFSETEVVVVFPPYEEGGDETTVIAAVLSLNTNDEYLITDNGDGTFGRYDWTFVGDDLFYCQIESAADSAEAAEANEAADRKSPTDAGCGDFGWTLLSPV